MNAKKYFYITLTVLFVAFVMQLAIPAYASNNDKNANGCDQNGSTGDLNGKPCDPGNNNASEQGCIHGEPDCDTPTPTSTPTSTPTATPTCTPTPTDEVTPTSTESDPTPTPTTEVTDTPTPTPTVVVTNDTPTPTIVPQTQAATASSSNSQGQVLGATTLAPTGNFLNVIGIVMEALSAAILGAVLFSRKFIKGLKSRFVK